MPKINLIHWTGAFALLAAMALLIVASVSSPIWNNVGYLKGEIQGRSITFGNWGWCEAGNSCTSSKLGYPRQFISSLTGTQNIASETVLRNLTFTLILTPIAAGLSFIALLLALPTKLVFGILGSIAAFLAFLVTIVSLGLDLGLFIVLRNRINNTGAANTHVGISSCIWLVVAAAGCQLWATITVCFTRSRKRRAHREDEFASVPAMSSTQHYASERPSTVGSTGPLIHDTTGVNQTYVQPEYNTAVPATTGTEQHAWTRREHTAI